jgi:ParB family transcriptional regulator, chromosome partitioning protein
MANRGLGRGLGALLGENYDESGLGKGNIAQVRVEDIVPNTFQPRKYFAQEALQELAASIRSQGVLQPIMVRPAKENGQYELIAGERRWRAAQMADLAEIPALIRTMSDEESLALALIENVQREDLNAIEQAHALQRLQNEFQATQNELAEKTGLSRSNIANLLRLLQLPETIQNDVLAGAYTAGHARTLMVVTEPESQNILREKILRENLSVRKCEEYAAYWKNTGAFPFAPGWKTGSPSKKSSENLALFEKKLLQCIRVKKIRLRGSENKGTMTVSYASAGEFKDLMHKLGVNPEDDGLGNGTE